MANKISWPNYPLDSWSIFNDRATMKSDPETVDSMNDRMATGNRRMAIPLGFGRGKAIDYDDDGVWTVKIRVPPYAKAIGVYARAAVEIDSDNPEANALLYYKFSGDGWSRYVAIEQVPNGVAGTLDPDTSYWDAVLVPFVYSILGAEPDSLGVLSTPLPIEANDQAQDVTIELKIESDLDVYLYEYGFFFEPYNGTPFPTV